MTRRRLRQIGWPIVGVLLIGVFGFLTYFVVSTAFRSGVLADVLAAGGYLATFVVGWRTFSRSHGDVPVNSTRQVPQWVSGWAVPAAVVASTVLANSAGDTLQMVGMAPVCGFMLPALYWVTRSFIKRPEARERLWSGQLTAPLASPNSPAPPAS